MTQSGRKCARDFTVEDHGSLCLLVPATDAVREWIEENVNIPDHMRCGNAYAMEPRCVMPIVDGLYEAGFTNRRKDGGRT